MLWLNIGYLDELSCFVVELISYLIWYFNFCFHIQKQVQLNAQKLFL